MELQVVVDLVGGAILAVIGWFARQLFQAVENLRRDVHDLEVDLPRNYVRKEEFVDTMKEIRNMVEKIYDKLDHKADK